MVAAAAENRHSLPNDDDDDIKTGEGEEGSRRKENLIERATTTSTATKAKLRLCTIAPRECVWINIYFATWEELSLLLA